MNATNTQQTNDTGEKNNDGTDAAGAQAEQVAANEKPAATDAPYPSQADLDAIREGSFGREKRDQKAKKGKGRYETR